MATTVRKYHDPDVLDELAKRASTFIRDDVADHARVVEVKTFPMADGSSRWGTTVSLIDDLGEETTYRITAPAPDHAPAWARDRYYGWDSDWLED